MAGLRGYPTAYKQAARDFQQRPPASPKKAVAAANDNVQAANDNALGPVIQELSSLTGYSQSTIEAVIAAAEEVAEQGSTAVRRVPARLLPVLNAFLLGYDAANAGIDAYQWWVSSQKNPNNTSADGFPTLGTESSYVAHQTGYLATPWTPGANPTDVAFGYSPDTLPSMPPTFGAGAYSFEVYWYWPFGAPSPSYFTGVLSGDTAPAGETLDPIQQTLGLPAAAATPAIPYKLIPYVNPSPVAVPEVSPASQGWYITNAPSPAEASGTKPAPPRTTEKKKQLSRAGAAAMRIAKALINAATESCDAIDAMWDAVSQEARINYGYQYEKFTYKRAVPEVPGTKGKIIIDPLGRRVVESSRLSRISCTRKAKAFAQNPRLVDDIDWDKAINNLVVNAIEDAVFGFAGQKANEAFMKNNPTRPVGLGTGTVF